MSLKGQDFVNYPTSKYLRGIEALVEVLLQLLGVLATYFVFNWIGKTAFNSDFSSETLFSLLLLPALYILKTANEIVSPKYVKVKISRTTVESRTGIFTQRLDKLQLKTVENIEVVSTIGGRFFNYGTICLYAHGSWVELPFLINPVSVKNELEDKIFLVRETSGD